MTGYAAFFIAMRRTRRGHYALEVQRISAASEGLDPPAFTQRYAALVEAQTRASPADWTWLHRRWKSARLAADTVTPGAPSQPAARSP